MSVLVILALLAVLATGAAVVAGRLTGGLPPVQYAVPQRGLPPGPVHPHDVRDLRFVPALRGYRMDQVDAALDRLALELEQLRAQLPTDRDGDPTGEAAAGQADGAPPELGWVLADTPAQVHPEVEPQQEQP